MSNTIVPEKSSSKIPYTYSNSLSGNFIPSMVFYYSGNFSLIHGLCQCTEVCGSSQQWTFNMDDEKVVPLTFKEHKFMSV